MFLGVDVGTGGTRAILINRGGKVIASCSAEHAPIHSEHIGWAEQDPDDWWRAAREAIAGAIAQSELAGSAIEAVGLTGQMHGCVMLDAAGVVLRPALIWCDQRTQPQCDWLTEKIGFERLIELTANPALPNFTLTKLLWVRDHQPEIFARIAHVLCPKDYVRYRLTGEFAMDMQEASGTLLLDVAHRRWSTEVAEAAGIPMQWLPRLYEGPEICARISDAGAGATGLAAGTPVAAGAGDQGAGAVGMGILAPGSVSATIGTSGVVFAATDAPTKDPLGRLHTFCHAAPNRWHVMGVTNGAGLSLRYFRDTFATSSSYDALSALAAEVPAASDGLLWAPYLFGERTPHLDPNARAAFVGITASHTQAHFVRAVLEGVAMSLRDTFTLFKELHIPVDSIRLGGGGARGPLWRQIQADVYGQPVELLEAEEGGAFGAALLAGTGVNAWPSVEAACAATIRVAQTIAPQNADAMNEAYRQYRKIYPALRDIAN
ncbi:MULTISPECIES: xylulokinase [Acidobacteriaceae]|uniref:xylulokinase n=1 Tax=Acidobacteriaceae TaxID=204434 RepID=UPI00131D218B|nr:MULTISPECIES: xylulokinase [Acidobacteriaceae]MDW5265269.1 xylulokinase [Edaphobacter sp.]